MSGIKEEIYMGNKLEEGLRKGLLAGLGLVVLTREKARQLARELVKKGEASSGNVAEVTGEILDKARKGTKLVEARIKEAIKKIPEIGNA
jgi:polyhydroxyalkanoate synthesis regulator phasin